MTQNEMVLQYIKDFGSISSLEAFKDLGITRLSGRIFDLKEMGHNLERKDESSLNRYGKKVTYGRYFLKETV